jgi:hypothetical protein
MRLEWVRPVVRGRISRLEIGLAGASLSVMGGLQDELFNFTLQHFVLHDVFTDSEIKVCGCEYQ